MLDAVVLQGQVSLRKAPCNPHAGCRGRHLKARRIGSVSQSSTLYLLLTIISDPLSMSGGLDCALGTTKTCLNPSACPFHRWLSIGPDWHRLGIEEGDSACPLPEARRLLKIFPPTKLKQESGGSGFRRAGVLIPTRAPATASASAAKCTPAPKSGAKAAHVRALTRFMRLVEHLNNAPWANKRFATNERILARLIASHLHLIVPGGSRSELIHLIDPRASLADAHNLVWVTNRQQGKTTTLGKFLAAMAIASPVGGLLFTVYSTSLDRAQELTKAAREYVYWLMSPDGAFDDFPSLVLERNNERLFCVSNGTASNTIIARPKNPDSCRGDAPHACILDEAAFVSPNFWWKFAFPLFQVGNRACTCATTPPPTTGFFAAFIEQVKKRNAEGDNFFRLINHSLTCLQCLEEGEAERCCHNLHLIPPWKSLVRFDKMKKLVPAGRRDDFAQEVFGVLGKGGNFYLPRHLIEAALSTDPRKARPRIKTAAAMVNGGPRHVWVSIDPASHAVSDLAIVAFIVLDGGLHVLLGAAAVNVGKCQTTEVQQIVSQFLARLRQHPAAPPDAALVPVVECNNNEILAMSIVRAFEPFGPVWMPFTEDRFQAYITDGIGVWTREENKMAAIQGTYQMLFDGRLAVADHFFTADKTAFAGGKSRPRPPNDVLELMVDQLAALQDQDDGTVSGKTLAGDNDDLAIATIMGFFWRMSCEASEIAQSY